MLLTLGFKYLQLFNNVTQHCRSLKSVSLKEKRKSLYFRTEQSSYKTVITTYTYTCTRAYTLNTHMHAHTRAPHDILSILPDALSHIHSCPCL